MPEIINRTGFPRFSLAACARQPIGPQRLGVCAIEITAASSEIQLLPAGPFRGVDGRPKDASRWQLDRERFAAWLAQASKSATRLAIDYEHESLPDENGRRRKWAAAGWFTAAGIEIRDNGVWATDVEWTDAARAAIEAREVAYISPVFYYDAEGAVIGLATHVAPAALTNTPAIDGMQQVLQAAANQFALANGVPEMDELIEMLGLPAEASAEDVQAAVKALQDRVAETEGQIESIAEASQGTLPDDVFGKITTAFKNKLAPEIAAASAGNPDPSKFVSVDVVEDLKGQVAALSAERTADKVEGLVSAALDDGRLLPAQKAWATELGKKDMAALTQYLDSAQPIAGLRGSQTNGQGPAGDTVETDEHGLTPNQLAVASNMGITSEEYAKQLTQESN